MLASRTVSYACKNTLRTKKYPNSRPQDVSRSQPPADWDPARIHLVWEQLAKEYGPIFRLDAPGQESRVFISDSRDIEHLMRETAYMPTKPMFDSIAAVRNHSRNIERGKTGLLSE